MGAKDYLLPSDLLDGWQVLARRAGYRVVVLEGDDIVCRGEHGVGYWKVESRSSAVEVEARGQMFGRFALTIHPYAVRADGQRSGDEELAWAFERLLLGSGAELAAPCRTYADWKVRFWSCTEASMANWPHPLIVRLADARATQLTALSPAENTDDRSYDIVLRVASEKMDVCVYHGPRHSSGESSRGAFVAAYVNRPRKKTRAATQASLDVLDEIVVETFEGQRLPSPSFMAERGKAAK